MHIFRESCARKRPITLHNNTPILKFVEMDMYSETDSTNECSDFKSELDEEDLEGAGNGNAPGAGGQHAGHAGPSRKSSGLSKRNNRHPRVVFV